MIAPKVFREYIWIVKTIYEANEITLAELSERWSNCELSYGNSLSRATFKRHKSAISDAFGIDIECKTKKGYVYYIANRSLMEKDSVQNWILSTLSVNSAIHNNLEIEDRIIVQEAPKGGRMLEMAMHAIKMQQSIIVSYKRFGQIQANEYKLDPYALKMFNQRWYIVAHSAHHKIAVYALDRIVEMMPTTDRFELPSGFDVRRFFSECYGVIVGDGTKAEKIRLRVFGLERDYLESLPFHHSQQLVCQNDEYSEYEYFLRPTYDFKQAVMANIADIEIIEPLHLRDKIAELLHKGLARNSR